MSLGNVCPRSSQCFPMLMLLGDESSIAKWMLNWKNFHQLSMSLPSFQGKLFSNRNSTQRPHNNFSIPTLNLLTEIIAIRWDSSVEWITWEFVWNEFLKNAACCYFAWLFSVMLFFFPCYVFADKMPVEKRDSIISDKKISPNGQGLYFSIQPKRRLRVGFWLFVIDENS